METLEALGPVAESRQTAPLIPKSRTALDYRRLERQQTNRMQASNGDILAAVSATTLSSHS